MPLLDVRFSKDGTSLYTGGLDKSLGLIDITTQTLITLGSHEEAIKEIVALDNQIITGSWDKSCKIWDTRSENPLVDTLIQPDKVF
jgi:WD40 repeat protein